MVRLFRSRHRIFHKLIAKRNWCAGCLHWLCHQLLVARAPGELCLPPPCWRRNPHCGAAAPCMLCALSQNPCCARCVMPQVRHQPAGAPGGAAHAPSGRAVRLVALLPALRRRQAQVSAFLEPGALCAAVPVRADASGRMVRWPSCLRAAAAAAPRNQHASSILVHLLCARCRRGHAEEIYDVSVPRLRAKHKAVTVGKVGAAAAAATVQAAPAGPGEQPAAGAAAAARDPK